MKIKKLSGGLRTQGKLKKPYEDKPLVSIITVVYNGEKFLEETILSVINQSYDNVEYIIIDGGSTDGTVDIIKKYEDMIDYWVSEKDRGIYDAMNKGIDFASGDYLLFLGADDILCDDILSDIFDNLMHPYKLIFGDVKYTNGLIVKSKFSYKTYLHNTIHHQGAFYNKILFHHFRYDIKYKIVADYELNLILYLKFDKEDFLKINKFCAICTDDGISRTLISQAHKEMSMIRGKYFNFFLNYIFTFLFKFKVFLIYLLKKVNIRNGF